MARLTTTHGGRAGPAIASPLMLEIGDIWRFENVDQLAASAEVHSKA
jgi:hypothetical protein